MKKVFSFLAIVMVALCAITFTSCSDDDDNKSGISTSDVVGTWVTTSFQADNGTWVDLSNPLYSKLKAYASFNSDGTYKGWGSLGTGTGTWKLKGNTLTTYVEGEVYITYKNIVLDGNKMSGTMVDDEGESRAFKAEKQ